MSKFYPEVRDTFTGSNGNVINARITCPVNVKRGDLILAISSVDSNATITCDDADWFVLYNNLFGVDAATYRTTYILAKVAQGNEGGYEIPLTLSATESITWATYSIKNFSGHISNVEINTGADGNSASPSTNSITTSWSSTRNLFINLCTIDNGTGVVSAYPEDYKENRTLVTNEFTTTTGAQTLAISMSKGHTDTSTPKDLTISSDLWTTNTIVIKGDDQEEFVFGSEENNGSNTGGRTSNVTYGLRYTPEFDAYAESVTFNCTNTSGDIYVAIYDDARNLLSSGRLNGMINGDNHVELSPKIKVKKGERYYLSFLSDVFVTMRSNSTNTIWYGFNSSFSGGLLPTFDHNVVYDDIKTPRFFLTGERIVKEHAVIPVPKEYHPCFKGDKQPTCDVEIDWDNPLTRGLQYFLMPTPTGHIELVDRELPPAPDTNNRFFGDGMYRNFRGSTASQKFSSNKMIGATESTTISSWRHYSSASQSMFRIDGTLTALQCLSSTIRTYFWNGGSGISIIGPSVSGFTVGDRHTWSTVWRSTEAMKGYHNGSYFASSSVASLSLADAGKKLVVGASESNTEITQNDIGTCLYFNRALSDAERITLENNPYQILKPRQQQYISFEPVRDVLSPPKMLPLPKQYHPSFRKPLEKPACPVEIDWSNPITRGLVGCYTMQGSLVNLVTGDLVQGTGETVGYDYIDFTGTTGVMSDIPLTKMQTKGTICAEVKDSTESWFIIAEAGQDSSGVRFGLNNAANPDWINLTVNSDSVNAQSHGPIVGAGWFPLGATWNADTNVRQIASNVDETINTGAFTAPAVTSNFKIGARVTWNDYVAEKIRYLYFWDRDLSLEELAEVRRNPYQLLKPAQPIYLHFEDVEKINQQPLFWELPKSYHPDFRNPKVLPNCALEIDWDNPISKNLIGAYVPDGDGMIDIITGMRSIKSGGGVTNQSHNTAGKTFYSDNAALHYFQGDHWPNYNIWSRGLTAVYYGSVDTPTSDDRYLGMGNDSGNTEALLGLGVAIGDTTTHRSFWRPHSHIGQGNVDSIGELSPRKPFFSGFSATSAKRISIVDDEVIINANESSIAAWNFNRISFGGIMRATTSNMLDCKANFGLLFDRALSEEELKILSKNPMQLFKPKEELVHSFEPQITIDLGSDIKVQRGTAGIASDALSVTLKAGVDYEKVSSAKNAFVRITGILSTGSGKDTQWGGQPRNCFAHIEDAWQIEDSITFTRNYSGGADYATIAYEIIEYVGVEGGENEFVVRHQDYYGTSTTNTDIEYRSAPIGVKNDDDVCVFLTGLRSGVASRTLASDSIMTTRWDSVNSQAVADRVAPNNASNRPSMAVVEFTGSNWTVQRVEHNFSTTGIETETISDVGSIDNAFCHIQSRSDVTSSTANDAFESATLEAWLSSPTEISFKKQRLMDVANYGVAWIVSNPQMNVSHFSGSRGDDIGADVDTFYHRVNLDTDDISRFSIMSECGTTDVGGDINHGQMDFELVDNKHVKIKRSWESGNRTYRFDITGWPTKSATSTINKQAKINFGRPIDQNALGWNKINSEFSIDPAVPLNDPSGVSTGWSFDVTTSFSSRNGNTLEDCKLHPTSVMNSHFSLTANNTAVAKITGLDDAKKYDLSTFGFSNLTGQKMDCDVTIGGVTKTLYANGDGVSGTSGHEIFFTDVSPTSGEIVITYFGQADNATAADINGVTIEEIAQEGVQTGLVIHSVTPYRVYDGLTNVVLSCSNAGNTQGIVSINGTPQTITGWSDNSISFNVSSSYIGTINIHITKGE